jgi:hypothetical protein
MADRIPHAAAIGVDQASQQPAWIPIDDGLLPWLELDGSRVLWARAMLIRNL